MRVHRARLVRAHPSRRETARSVLRLSARGQGERQAHLGPLSRSGPRGAEGGRETPTESETSPSTETETTEGRRRRGGDGGAETEGRRRRGGDGGAETGRGRPSAGSPASPAPVRVGSTGTIDSPAGDSRRADRVSGGAIVAEGGRGTDRERDSARGSASCERLHNLPSTAV